MADLPKTLAKLLAKLVAYQGKRLAGEGFLTSAAEVLSEYAGEAAMEKLENFLDQGERAEKLAKAFEAADECFKRKAAEKGEEYLRQAVASLAFTRNESLEALAKALPETLDDDGLLAALRGRFDSDWPGKFTPAQLDWAARTYRDCLSPALAAKCDQLGIWTYLEVRAARADLREIKSLIVDANSLGQIPLPREWLRPQAPRPSRPIAGRVKERKAVKGLLVPGAKAAITATVHGTPGVGKTLLAEHLAVELDPEYPRGVFFERLGYEFRSPDVAGPILLRWASHAFGGRALPEGTSFTPDAVRALLAGNGALLAVLDDVWDRDAIQPLLAALPNDAAVLIVTRSQKLARDLGYATYELNVLVDGDALDLLRHRAAKSTEADVPLLKGLAGALGCHAQALFIAGGSLDRLPRSRWSWAVEEMSRQVREGSGFGELRLPGDEPRVSEVEAALKFSYDDLDETARARFRALGAFAPDASFNISVAAGVWECSPEEAEGQLIVFVERGLLSPHDSPLPLGEGVGVREDRFQQHSLLRAYALALLRRDGEEDAGRRKHAEVYDAMMREADDRQVYYRMLPDYAQLRHAFEWAIEHDLALARSFVANTANLQAGFNFVRDSHDWASRLESRAREAGDDDLKGAALGSLANALSTLAGLGGEDRGARLREALAAYDAALAYRTPARAPLAYAMTQTNRGLVLTDIAGLGGEDHGARLRAALDACDAALAHYTPERAPLDHAMTQNNRGTVLLNIAGLGGEDRGARLREALAAFTEAIRLQPDEAMYHRNHASTNIDLGDFDAAEAGLKHAAELESDHPRLAELRQQLDEARRKRAGSSEG